MSAADLVPVVATTTASSLTPRRRPVPGAARAPGGSVPATSLGGRAARRRPAPRAASSRPAGWRRGARCRPPRRSRTGSARLVRPSLVDHHAAAAVVRGRHHRDGLHRACRCRARGSARGCWGSGARPEVARQVGHVEETQSAPRPLQLGVDGAGHDVARRESPLVVPSMNAAAVGRRSMPPSPRSASVIRKLLACGW